MYAPWRHFQWFWQASLACPCAYRGINHICKGVRIIVFIDFIIKYKSILNFVTYSVEILMNFYFDNLSIQLTISNVRSKVHYGYGYNSNCRGLISAKDTKGRCSRYCYMQTFSCPEQKIEPCYFMFFRINVAIVVKTDFSSVFINQTSVSFEFKRLKLGQRFAIS